METKNTLFPAAATTTIQQSCAIPFRRQFGQTEFCLITSAKKRRWIFPKGGVETGETPEQTALKEALEEAGLLGRVRGEPLGEYQYAKRNATCQVTVFLMNVVRWQEWWQEADRRERRWVKPSTAKQLLSRPELADFLELAAFLTHL